MSKPAPKIIVFADLDDTLITSRRKASQSVGVELAKLVCCNSTFERDTVQLPAQSKLQQLLGFADCFIPVTGRAVSSLLKALPNADYPIALSHFGGWAITNENSDSGYQAIANEWNVNTTLQRSLYQNDFFDLINWIQGEADACKYPYRTKINKTPDQLINEFVVKFDSPSDHRKHGWHVLKLCVTAWVESRFSKWESAPFELHINDNNFSLMLRSISKKEATSFVLSKLDSTASLVISAGDSLTDLGFMKQADYMIIPSESQISKGLLNDE